MTEVTYARLIPYVGFNVAEVALYMVPLNEERRARHLVLKLPRDSERRDQDPNVRLIRAMEKAALLEQAAQIDEGLRPREAA